MRLAEARARLDLREVVTAEDAEVGVMAVRAGSSPIPLVRLQQVVHASGGVARYSMAVANKQTWVCRSAVAL